MSQRPTETCLLLEDLRAPSLSVDVVWLKVASYTKAAHEFRGVPHRVAPALLHIWQKREHIWSCFRLRGALAVIISLLHVDRVLRDLKFGQRDQEKTHPWYFSIIVLSHWRDATRCWMFSKWNKRNRTEVEPQGWGLSDGGQQFKRRQPWQ